MKHDSDSSRRRFPHVWTAPAVIALVLFLGGRTTCAQGEPPPQNNGSGTKPKPGHHHGSPPTSNTPPSGLVTPFRPEPEPEPEPPTQEPLPNPAPNPTPNPAPNPAPVPTPQLPSVAPVAGPAGATVPPARAPTTTPPRDVPPSGRWRGRTPAVSLTNWETWWRYNRDDLIIRKRAQDRPGDTSQDAGVFLGALRRAPGAPSPAATSVARVRAQVIPILLEALEDRSPSVRTAACIALGKVGTADHVPVLAARLSDSTGMVREAAALGLGLLEQPAARSPLLAVLRSGHEGARLRGGRPPETSLQAVAALALGLTGPDPTGTAHGALIRVSGHRTAHRDLTLLATLGLGALKASPAQVRPVSWHLKNLASRRRNVNDWVRAQAVIGIGRLIDRNQTGDDTRTLAGLARLMLSDHVALVRQSAVTALGQATLGPERRRAAVRALLVRYRKAASLMERHLAAVALGRLGGDEAYAALILGVRESSQSLHRVYSALGLALLMRTAQDRTPAGKTYDPRRGLDCLRRAFLREKNVSVRAGLALALGIARDRAAGPVLLKTLESTANPELRSYLGLALGMVGHEPAAAHLTRLILHTRDAVSVKERLAIGLGMLGVKNLLPLLSALKTSRSGYETEAILQALGRVGDPSAVKPIAELALSDRAQIRTRASACLALGRLGDPRPVPVLAWLRAGHNYLAASDAVNALLTRDF